MTVEAADVLDKAADLIDPAKGGRWIRGAFADDAGGYCLLGAIGAAAGVPISAEAPWPNDCRQFVAARHSVSALLQEEPANWNDQSCLDGAEATNLLRKAAEIERHT